MTTKTKRAVRADQSLDIITRTLESYAQRGVFRSYSPNRKGTGAAAESAASFHFYWLWNLPFHLTYNSKKKALEFPKLFPNMVRGSAVETDLKNFIKQASSADRPEHRRLDPRRVAARYHNRQNKGSLEFLITGRHHEYAVKHAVNLVHEIFVGLLNVRHPDYMAENFRMPEEGGF